MDDNPYRSPTAGASATATTAGVRIDGKYLVVPTGAVLPPFCVKTGDPVQQQDVQTRHLNWCPPIVGLLILLSGLILIVVYFIARKHCTITFGVSPAIRRKYRNRQILKVIAVIVLFFALPFSAAMDNSLVIAAVFILFLVAIVSLFLGNSPLAIARYRKGEFWISGCSKEFLSRIHA